ncbi:xin actin-binding repeat-containing protein 1 [Neosynchiropus ocellatus]
METLRRTQSLKNLSGDLERSWIMPASYRWDRKSVSQLVQHYQSGDGLRSPQKADHRPQVFGNLAAQRWRRCRSMELLPQNETSIIRTMCALFESKAADSLDISSPEPRTAKIGRDRPLVEERSQARVMSRSSHAGRRHTTTVFQESDDWVSRNSLADKPSPLRTPDGISARQSRDRITSSSSVRSKSAVYLSRASAFHSTGDAPQAEVIAAQPKRSKNRTMADAVRKVSHPEEDDLPLPPPPPGALDYGELSELSSLPVPPPKETFSTYYQQRQKSELKRLFKHIHPDLRESLDGVVDDDILKAVQSESTQAADAAYQGEVQSMRWIFENWNLDNIGDPHETKKMLHEEGLLGADVRGTSSMFESSSCTRSTEAFANRQTSVRGDVRTSTWLFETQPLDSLNKREPGDGELVEAVLKEQIQPGDVSGTRQLFETKALSELGRCNSIEDNSFLKLKSELQEQKGDVQKTVKLFHAEPGCAIRDKSGNIHRIKSICREEINSGNTSTARWLFETQPLDLINKERDGVKIIRGISLEDGHDGGVERKRWMFETQSFDAIQEVVGQTSFEGTQEADVSNKKKLFEMQPLAALKGDAEEKTLEKEEIIGGDVRTSLWLFETQPMDALSDSCKVGCLQKITLSSDEQGEVKGKKLWFESCAEEKRGACEEKAIEKGDVKGFKHLFETIPLGKIVPSDSESLGSQNILGEHTLLYAIEDSSGNFHGITTVSREESIKGNVQNYKWMFETQPLQELTGGNEKVEVLKGITREEGMTGDVKTAKWMFETQTVDGIHAKFNQPEPSSSEDDEPRKGDVKTCKWLFETKPMDMLYDKEVRVDNKEAIDKTDVKSITWLFESQPLDSIQDGEEYSLKLCGTIQDAVKSECDVRTAKHLFETENLDRIRKDPTPELGMRFVSKVDFQSGDVSRVKELFESQSLDEIGSEMEMSAAQQINGDEIQSGSVHKFTWLFENSAVGTQDSVDPNRLRVSVDECGDVQNKKFVFETSSLDNIHDHPCQEQPVCVEPMSEVDVKSSTMMFESRPLYAIRDKEGQFHEVTTVKKEEILSGDVRGARWQFETKPLDAIKAENEVYVIRAVTQEDVQKGDVKSARWKFETQPLDTLACPKEPSVRVVDECTGKNVQVNREIFESQQANTFVRMVSVTDVQQGDVRTSTWLFENHSMDSLKGDSQEDCPLKTVHREDSQKGDVKRCTWLFETKPLDKITEPREIPTEAVEEGIPKADVKCTTWLFETTPLDKITVHSVSNTLSYLQQMGLVHSSGIIIEANEITKVSMAKFDLESQTGIHIVKEELISGNIRSIMLQLLLKQTNIKVVLLKEVEKGTVEKARLELPIYESTASSKRESDPSVCKTFEIIDELFQHDKNLTKGIIMQEPSEGPAEMMVYSLVRESDAKTDGSVIEKGDVKSAIGNLLATSSSQRTVASCRVDDNEKGNVTLYKSCIEKGDLQYLKSLQMEEAQDDSEGGDKENIEIIQGDIKEAKKSLSLQKDQVERTVVDVLPGDVKNTKKVFSSAASISVDSCIPKEEIIPGDVTTAKQQLSVMPPVMVEKEEIVAGDIKATMQSLERAKQQSMCVEREVVKPGTIYDMDLSAKCPETEGTEAQRELIISGDVKAAKKSLEMAKQQSMHVERDVIVPGKLYNLNVSVQEESSSALVQSSSSSRCQQVKTNQKSPPPSVNADCNGVASVDETEDIVRGDVKAAIRSLQSAAAEQRLFDKEDIVRGNVQLALESLEKSSVNVSKGDFNAAMIYMNSGRRKKVATNACQGQLQGSEPKQEEKVVLREKKPKETEDERRQRLSVHKEEIMKGNVKAAMEIFENLRKREELKDILSQVQEIEGESSNVDMSSLKTLYSSVPTWVGQANGRERYSKQEEKKVEAEAPDDDLESISSVESAFEDLERASKEIMHLKEQTLTKLLELEETIKKALYSVSNLKSESDIAGLSGLFDESLKSGEHNQPLNNIRKISIGSSKAKSIPGKDLPVNLSSPSKLEEATKVNRKPLVRQSSAQSSPSFISIHSAARKPTKEQSEHGSPRSSKETAPAQRKVSVLEVKTLPEQPSGINCKKTVSETYEETDGFGNVFVSSVTSTFVSTQSDSKSAALFEVVGGPSRYEVNASPSLRRPAGSFGGSLLSNDTEKGNVFVTFSRPGEK